MQKNFVKNIDVCTLNYVNIQKLMNATFNISEHRKAPPFRAKNWVTKVQSRKDAKSFYSSLKLNYKNKSNSCK